MDQRPPTPTVDVSPAPPTGGPGDVVDRYVAATDGPDPASAVDLFTPDAVVTDDGAVHRGRAEVLGWLRGAVSEWTTTSTRTSLQRRGRTVVLRTRVEGDFPGGLVDLRAEFGLAADGRIERLSITA